MGANQRGEIAWLGSIAKPSVAIVTNVSASHIEGFGSVDAVFREKSSIYTSLVEGGTAVINRDDQFADDWMQLNHDRNVLTFGSDNKADVFVERIDDQQIRLHCQVADQVATADTLCQLAGDHNLVNIAAAAAAAVASGIDLASVARGVANAMPVKGRLNFHQLKDEVTLIDDTYNANPASVRAAIEVLTGVSKKHWLVLGDLKELGDGAATHHSILGKFAHERGVDRVFTLGEMSRYCATSFGKNAERFDDRIQLIDRLEQELDKESGSLAVLVKGSRSMSMDLVVDALIERYSCTDASVVGGAV